LPSTSETTRGSSWRSGYAVGLTALATYSTAIGWQAQLVSYPLYRAVGEEEFPDYHLQYGRSIPAVVIVPGFMTFLGGTAFGRVRPAWISRRRAWFVAGCGATSLLSTVLWAIPRHDELDRAGRSDQAIDSLIKANTVRTAALSAMAVALVGSVARRVVRADAG
jgi:hypothetical protein